MDRLQPRVASESESLRRSVAAGNEELSLSFPAPCFLRLLSRATSFIAIDFSLYPLNGGLVSRLIRFSLLWEMDASSSQWLIQFQAYPYPLKQLTRADISFGSRYRARADKIAQTLVCSQIRQFHITFGRFIFNYREKISPFLDKKIKKSLLPKLKVSLCCFKMLKMLRYNFV